MLWSSQGSEPKQVTGQKANEPDHEAPQFLPGGRSFLYAVRRLHVVETWLGYVDGRPPRLLLPAFARYAPPGYLLYANGNSVLARRFDPSTGALAGAGATVLSAVASLPADWRGFVSTSETGSTLAFLRDAPTQGTCLAWYDRAGRAMGSVGGAGDYSNPALSPDGRRLAVSIRDFSGRRDIHVFDLARGVETRLTFESRDNTNPIWSADGSQIAYSSNPRGYHEIYVHPSSGIGQQRVLLESNVD